MTYKWSNYNYFAFNPNNFICYNTKSGAVSFGETEIFDSKYINKDASALVNHEYFPFFLENRFIVSADTDELEELRDLNSSRDNHTMHLTLVPTLNCNFKCSYCYQKDTHDNYNMTHDLKQGALEFIRIECLKHNVESIQLTWFGGEPTLSVDLIEEFMRDLTGLSRATTGFKTTTSLITNGYLLTPEIFERLYNSYVRIFQVTLDGMEDNHDKYRLLVDGTKTFSTIYNNLILIRHFNPKDYNFLLQIRANFFKDNLASMKKLVESYSKEFKGDKRFSISFRPIIDFTGDLTEDVATKFEARKMEACMLNYMQSKEVEADNNNPMFTLLPMPVSQWCKASEKLRYVINYDGSVFRCNSAMTNEKHRLGFLKTNGSIILDENAVRQWNSPIDYLSPSCLRCKRLPVCMGGCKKERIEYGKTRCHWTDIYINNVLSDLLNSINN